RLAEGLHQLRVARRPRRDPGGRVVVDPSVDRIRESQGGSEKQAGDHRRGDRDATAEDANRHGHHLLWGRKGSTGGPWTLCLRRRRDSDVHHAVADANAPTTAWPAASLAVSTRNGEQLT